MIELAISNSSPLISLSRLNRLDLLQNQITKLIVPEIVAHEVGTVPEWAIVQSMVPPNPPTNFPNNIHPGEIQVLLLGQSMPEAILILDDQHARNYALKKNLKVIGTIGLILRAREKRLIAEVKPILDQLNAVHFRLSSKLYHEILSIVGEE